jgi:hypothetical protein
VLHPVAALSWQAAVSISVDGPSPQASGHEATQVADSAAS